MRKNLGREAAVGIQRRCIRQRITCAVLRAQADVLLGRMKYALPGWAQAEARREGQAEAHRAAQAQAEASGGFRGGRWDGDDGGVGDGGGDDAGWWCTRGRGWRAARAGSRSRALSGWRFVCEG